MSYVDEVLERVVAKNPAEPEFHQAVKDHHFMLAGNQRHRIAESGILKIRLLNIISDHFSATPYYIDQIPHSNYAITVYTLWVFQ